MILRNIFVSNCRQKVGLLVSIFLHMMYSYINWKALTIYDSWGIIEITYSSLHCSYENQGQTSHTVQQKVLAGCYINRIKWATEGPLKMGISCANSMGKDWIFRAGTWGCTGTWDGNTWQMLQQSQHLEKTSGKTLFFRVWVTSLSPVNWLPNLFLKDKIAQILAVDKHKFLNAVKG